MSIFVLANYEDTLKEISEAYQVLRDQQKRTEYDSDVKFEVRFFFLDMDTCPP